MLPVDGAVEGRAASRGVVIFKLCITIVQNSDGDRLLSRLSEMRIGATRLGSTGGMLRRGSVTVFSAVDSEQVPDLVSMLRREFPAVTVEMPSRLLAYVGEDEAPDQTVEVRAGGAVLFVVPMERFERI